MVMELSVKGDLLNYINRKRALSELSSCRLFTQLCRAMEYLHSRNVAHRDLKCENLLLDAKNNLKVGDFGLSKTLAYADGRIVLSKTFCGTSLYAAPEILQRLPYDPKVSDVWSMGVVLHVMLYSLLPFNCSNIKKQVQLQKKCHFNFPKAPAVSSAAKDLIRRTLHPSVEQRLKVSEILESAWVSKGRPVEERDGASTSAAAASPVGSGLDAEEEPSAPRTQR